MDEKRVIILIVVVSVLTLGIGAFFAVRLASPTVAVANSVPTTPARPVLMATSRPTAEPISEVDRLRAENERLRQQAEAATDAARKAAQQAQAAKDLAGKLIQQQAAANHGAPLLTGSMWLNRNNGSSDIQRGITLCLVPQTMTREQAAAVLSGALRMCRQDAEETKQKIDQENFDAEKRRKENPEIAKYIDGASDFETKQVSDDLQRASDIDAIIKALPAKIETVDVYALMKKESQYGMPYMSHGISSTVLYKARTGVDGKYAFANAVPGDYMIWGEIDTKGLYADWLVPVTITAQPQSVDLFNDNAATIHN